MKKIQSFKSSFLYRFIIYFVILIIIPILCTWWIYEKVLHFYYVENTLNTKQMNLENSRTMLEATLNAASNTFVAVEGNQEVLYYMEYRPDKSNMFYGTYKRVSSFCAELRMMTPYLTKLKIYSDSPLPIYADPFVKMKNFNIDEGVFQRLEKSGLDIIWQISDIDTEDFPEIHGYKKLYDEYYKKCLGYMEIQLSSKVLSEFWSMIYEFSDNEEVVLSLYYGDTPIYSTFTGEIEPISYDEIETGNEIIFSKNLYRNYLKIPELNLCFIFTGRLSDVDVLPAHNMPSLFFSILFVLLLALFFIFFMMIISLSKRIMAFSSFIQYSNPERLLPFQTLGKVKQRKDELDVLVETYNMLIKEKNSLISEVQKMELFTQDARFQALQGQIHPHFIYGTLETIRMTALQNKNKEAAGMIFSLSTLLRYSMSISSKAVTLKEELEIARHYLEIQKMRFEDRMGYAFHVEEKLLDMEMPSFILQPILENAVVYGVSQTLEHCTLTVDAYEEGSHIVLNISNTGLPITEQRLQEVNELLSGAVLKEEFKGKRNGLALNNIKERLSIFFGGRASIQLLLQEDRTVTEIMIKK